MGFIFVAHFFVWTVWIGHRQILSCDCFSKNYKKCGRKNYFSNLYIHKLTDRINFDLSILVLMLKLFADPFSTTFSAEEIHFLQIIFSILDNNNYIWSCNKYRLLQKSSISHWMILEIRVVSNPGEVHKKTTNEFFNLLSIRSSAMDLIFYASQHHWREWITR